MSSEGMRPFELIALTPPALADPSIAIAASRAGGLGVLDLEYVRDERIARAAIAELSRYARRACGIKLDGQTREFVAAVASELPEHVKVVILTPGDPDGLRQEVEALRRRDRTVVLEATCPAHALLGEEIGVDGLIAKGHEAGGRVGEETIFILLQRLLPRVPLPVWAHGGIGLHTAGACYVAGAAGVVLDAQLLLTRESPLPELAKTSIGRMDGSETTCLGTELGESYRAYARPGQPAIDELRQTAKALAEDPRPRSEILAAWRQAIRERAGWDAPERHVWLVGQDVAFAAPLAERFRTVGGVLEGVRQAIGAHVRAARALKPLDDGAALARSHGTRYPIVQGPMTRVSDRAEFALRVAEGGALPLLALALMRAPEVGVLLEETRRLLGNRPWGVGILGFVPLELRQEQLEVIRAYRPPFALIAGGRPDQACSLEKDGIPTYLHVPSPGLLRMFLQDGARRFVFEGRECGGHVGPRSSFVLWNTMTDVLLDAVPPGEAEACHVLFAGGIHDALSASMVAAIAAPLAEQGMRVGVLVGTAYLFTQEAVASGAILPGFQKEALRCRETVLLETGPGHAIRCIETPYAAEFDQEKRRLLREMKSAEEIRLALENMNIGRLRIASKGIDRRPRDGQDPEASKFVTLSEADQHARGMYMIGQVAALRDGTCRMAELHHEIAVEGSRRLEDLPVPAQPVSTPVLGDRPSEIAIVGMSCILPKAPDLHTYWENILNKVNAITEIPEDRWDWRQYYDPDPRARDRIYSRWGGFIDDVPFDPVEYGMPPTSLPSIDPMQLLALKAARAVLEDAGYLNRPFDRSRTSVILGASGGTGDLGTAYLLRSSLPLLFGDAASDIISNADGILPEWTEDSFPGLLLNVAAGRITNRFDFGGLNYVVDAACASSLTAVHLAVKELETHATDMVIVGGVDTVQNPFGYLCFSKTQALSPTGQPRTFDASADGIAIGEGVVMLVLKRLADAERDGDRIYAVVQGVGGSSDGKAKGLTAPRPEGQILALRRAYAKAGLSPTTVRLFEAHGTGTVVGDRTEALALSAFLEEAGAVPQSCAIGSVKSMIGHTKATAGVAGLTKVALALYHRVLPPTLGVTQPNPKARFGEGPLYVNSETRPWLHGVHTHPRRAGVSAFGFGGTNFHAVVEEYPGSFLPREAAAQRWPSELLLWSASSRQELLSAVESLNGSLQRGARPALRDLAYTLWEISDKRVAADGGPGLKLAVVASSLEDLRQKLDQARAALAAAGPLHIQDPGGIYFTEEPLAREGNVAFLFPGQGSQYPNMLRDLAVRFSEVREEFERADRVLAQRFPKPLSSYVFPPPAFSPEEEHAQQQALTQTTVAQPALGAADLALFRLLQALGVEPQWVAGHSYGEYAALCAAGVFDEETLAVLSEARGRCIIEAATQDLGAMAAVDAGPGHITEALGSLEGVWIANFNAPQQTIISGTRPGVEQAIERLKARGIQGRPIPVACAFHSPLIASARDRLAEILSGVEFRAPQRKVFSNASAAPYPDNPQAVAALLTDHLVTPVRFADEVEAMYRAGARIFVEVGPRNVLTGLTQQILRDEPHLAFASDVPGQPGLVRLLHLLGQLAAHGVPVQLDRLYQGRAGRRLSLDALEDEGREKPLSPTTWLVNGGRARPLREPAGATRDATVITPPPSTARARDGSDRAPTRATLPTGTGASPPAPSDAPAGPPASPGDEVGKVMLRFQQLMDRFLDTQRTVMLRYLERVEHRATGDAQVPAQAAPLPAPAAPPPPEPEQAGRQPAGEAGSRESEWTPPDSEQLTRQLLRIVSERTGYPPEMLGLDMDIEADLGIDSIKRVEILGAYQRAAIPSGRQIDQKAMEHLTAIKTLRGIVDWLEDALRAGPEEGAEKAGVERPRPAAPEPREGALPPGTTPGPDGGPEVPRSILIAVESPPVRRPAIGFAPDRVLLITDDQRGVARAVAELVRARGGCVALLPLASEAAEIEGEAYRADLTDPDRVAELVAIVRRQHGPIGGIVHLLPLRDEAQLDGMDLGAWRERLRREVKSLFYLSRAAAEELKQAGKAGAGWLVAATAMGSAYPPEVSGGEPFSPGQGGVAGFVKTAALDWPAVRCKVVHVDPASPASTLAEQLVQEMAAGDAQVEVGYRGGRRWVREPRVALLDDSGPTRLAIDSDWVVLVTGGARGITAEVACELAERYRPTLLLVGSSPAPDPEESPHTAGVSSPQELKAVLMAELRRAGEPVTPHRVEVAYGRLLKEREIRENLARIERARGAVRYYQADLRDEQAVARVIRAIYQEYGRLDGVIHGAGIIEDRLVEHKTPESFDRVFDTKADSAFILSRSLRPESLKFLAFFASAAGSFGNRGQCDYAAANEVLNKLAIHLDKRWPGRVVSINWGPWAKTGMVSSELQRQFAQRGVRLISIPEGRRLFDRELRYGRKGEPEVIVAGRAWGTAEPLRNAAAPATLPLLHRARRSARDGNVVEVDRTLDPAHDLYLRDHQLDGKPVLPVAMAIELMAEGVQASWSDLEVVAVRDLRVLRGVILEDGPRSIRLVARARPEPPVERLGVNVDVEITDAKEAGRPYYRATVELADRLPEAPPYQPPFVDGLQPFPMTVEEAYRRWLFHGPVLQGISEIQGISQLGIVATCTPSSPRRYLTGDLDGQWLIDPMVFDSGLQLIILWARAHHDVTPLPARFQRYRCFGLLSGPPIRCHLLASATPDRQFIHASIFFVGPDGRLLGVLEDLECTSSKALNRLAGSHLRN